ncbi:MAG: hypothetical protein AB1599_08805 [Planctomycetota bacterium]
MKILEIFNKKIIRVILIAILVCFALWLIDVGNIPNDCINPDSIEYLQASVFPDIYKAQEEFKKAKIKDRNNNDIGEYATSLELAEYLYREGKDKTNLPKSFPLGKDGDFLHCAAYRFRIFLPDQISEQEKYWLCLAIPESDSKITGYGRSYFSDNKRDMIFYAERSSLERLKVLDEWSLKKIFRGEPFISPIDSSRWKILDRNLR